MSAKTSHRRHAARTVKFTAAALADLAPGVQCFPGAADEPRDRRFVVQAELPNGRLNVSFDTSGHTQYRTLSPRDVEAA